MITRGVGLFPTADVPTMRQLAKQAEDLGYANVWFGDSPNIWREGYVTMAACAVDTERIIIGTGVTNPVTRHPSVMASTWATLAEWLPGRVALGIGVGDSALETMGRKPATLATLERWVANWRKLQAGEEALEEHSGKPFHLAYPVPGKVPVYIGASAPKILKLAGRIADGVIMLVGTDPIFIEAGLRTIEEGAKEAGRSPADIDVVLWTPTSILDDRSAARDVVRAHVARIVIRPLPADLPPDEMDQVRRIRESYDYYQHMVNVADHGSQVPDSLVDHFALAGTPDECAAQLRRISETGVNQVAIVPFVTPGDSRARVIEAFAQLPL
ncbi:MAG TPA: LLM class flavin-dependent oxidoreductase [Chloroflexota bacterium]|nr:LLM class flavin-dependent oxidoreductase [Chloroflexota bacterium]